MSTGAALQQRLDRRPGDIGHGHRRITTAGRTASVNVKAIQPGLTRGLQFLLDIATLVVAFVLAYLLRFEFAVPDTELGHALQQLPVRRAGAVRGPRARRRLQLHLALRRHGGGQGLPLRGDLVGARARDAAVRPSRELRRLARPAVRHSDGHDPRVRRRAGPARSAPPLLRGLPAPRARRPASKRPGTVPTLLVGAGRAGVLAAREIMGRGDVNLDVKGFIDDDPEKKGRSHPRDPVLGDDRGPSAPRQASSASSRS